MTTIYRWLGLSLAVLAAIGMVLIPASPVDAAVAGNERQITLRTYNVVVDSFRNDPALYRQLTAKVARLTTAELRKVKKATRIYETKMKKPVKRVSDSGQAMEFSSQAKAPAKVTVTLTVWDRLEAFFKALQGALPLAALFIPAAATLTPIVVFILVIVSAASAVFRGYETLRAAR